MALTKVILENINKFLNEDQEVYTTGKNEGKKKWKKVPVKKMAGLTLCLDANGQPLFQYNDGRQRTGLTIKDMEQFNVVMSQMLNLFVNNKDYFVDLAKHVFNSDNVNSDNVMAI